MAGGLRVRRRTVARVWEWTEASRGEPRLRWGFTRADEGVSRGPYAGLNLAHHVGDDPVAVQENRARLAKELGVVPDRLVFMNQVHGAHVTQVSASQVHRAAHPEADGMVAAETGLALAVLVADCVPVLLADPGAGVIGVAHAGRPGMIAGVVPAVVEAMRKLGAAHIVAAVGPSVCGRCYEVPEEMRDGGAAVAPVSATVSWTGTPALDIAAGVVSQLAALGVPLTWVPGCTRESGHLYSYRRANITGRFAGVVLLEES